MRSSCPCLLPMQLIHEGEDVGYWDVFIHDLKPTHVCFREYQYRMLYPRKWDSGLPWYLIITRPLTRIFSFEVPLWRLCDTPVRYVFKEFEMSLRKALSTIKQAEVNLAAPECPEGVLSDAPTVWEFLSVTAIDGKSRQTSTMSIWVTDGAVTLCLNERDAGLSLYAGGATLEEAVRCLESKLNSESPEWRRGYQQGGKKRK